jgi:hypothetical protein
VNKPHQKITKESYNLGTRYLQIHTKNTRLGKFTDWKLYDAIVRLEGKGTVQQVIEEKIMPFVLDKLQHTKHNHYSIMVETIDGDMVILKEEVV